MIKPTIGRQVWYWRAAANPATEQPEAATVCHVWTERSVNLQVLSHMGEARTETTVPLRQPEDDKPAGAFCEWMPFQKGQAQKTEQLEAAVGSAS